MALRASSFNVESKISESYDGGQATRLVTFTMRYQGRVLVNLRVQMGICSNMSTESHALSHEF